MTQKQPERSCPDCNAESNWINRREFLRTTGTIAVAGAAAASLPVWAMAAETAAPAVPDFKSKPESIVKALYGTLNDSQKSRICFDWDFKEEKRGLLRTRVSNNWNITPPSIGSDFFTKDQQQMIREVFEGMYQPDWVKRIDKQLHDDAGGYGKHQSIAIFGHPGIEKFEFVMTGRHLTIRCDGHSNEHVAFGGPIFYGHAASGFNEKADHPGNVFWPQALEANKIYKMLDERHKKLALVENLPLEESVGFQGPTRTYPGCPVSEFSSDQKAELQRVLTMLLEPYRTSGQQDALRCLKAQGGLDKCSLAFYKEGDIGNDQVWDCWRLEGPSLVWYFRGAPHVHVWVNIADDPTIDTNA